MGRPESLGASHASATIRQICSSPMTGWRPGRGRSVKRAATDRSARVKSCCSRQRWRHSRTVSISTETTRAIWLLECPSAASSTIRARRATCWGVPCRRVSSSRSRRSSSVNAMSGGFGPRTAPLGFSQTPENPTILPSYLRLAVLEPQWGSGLSCTPKASWPVKMCRTG